MITSPISMVIIGKDPQERASARVGLLSGGKVHVVAESSDFDRGTELIEQFQPHSALIILNGEDGPLELVGRISEQYPSTAVICTGANCPSSGVVKAFRYGAAEFLCQPLKEAEVEQVLARVVALRGEDEVQTQGGKVIALYSSRGGTGVTTLGVNLATAITKSSDKWPVTSDKQKDSSLVTHHSSLSSVVLVDLNLQYGAIPLFFGLDPEYTIADVVRNQDRLDAQLLKSFLLRASDKLYCLPAPLRVEEADDVQPGHVSRIISMLRTQFRTVIIDCHHLLDANTVMALDLADTVLLVSLVDVPSVYCTKRVLEVFQKMGFSEEKVRVVINRYDKRDGVPINKVEEVFSANIEMVLDSDTRATLQSINMGNPLIQSQPKSVLVKQYTELASRLTGSPAKTTPDRNKKKGFSLFGGVLGT